MNTKTDSNPSIEPAVPAEPDHAELATHAETESRFRAEHDDDEPTFIGEAPYEELGGESGGDE